MGGKSGGYLKIKGVYCGVCEMAKHNMEGGAKHVSAWTVYAGGHTKNVAYFKASFRALPGTNLGTLRASMLIS